MHMAKHRKPDEDDGYEDDIYCDRCGKKCKPSAKFCGSCGNELPKKRGGTGKIKPLGKHRKKDK